MPEAGSPATSPKIKTAGLLSPSRAGFSASSATVAHAALVVAARILDGDHREFGPEPGLDQPLGDDPRRGHAHVDEERVIAGGKRLKIEMLERRLGPACFVTRPQT